MYEYINVLNLFGFGRKLTHTQFSGITEINSRHSKQNDA